LVDDIELGSGQPDWTSKEDKRGVDPLGMQTTSVALYQQLLPGISNVTLRMRYYGFYAWLAQAYARDVGVPSVERWCQYLRRAEALYALIAQFNGGERGVAGTRWANRKLETATRAHIIFHPNTDRDSGEPQYLKQKFGAFGAAYGSQLVEIGLLEYVEEHEIPVPSAGIGDAVAKAFGAAIGDAADIFLSAASAGKVKKTELESMEVMRPSRIGKSSRERKLYQDVLFLEGGSRGSRDFSRSQSLRLVLRIALDLGSWVDVDDVRWALYSGRSDTGEALAPMPNDESEQRFAWTVYQANDLLHVCYEALLKFTLDVLSTHPSGLPMDQLVGQVVGRLQNAFEVKYGTWNQLLHAVDLAADAWSDEAEFSEYSLLKAIFLGADPLVQSSDECGVSAIILLAVLYKRFENHLAKISTDLPIVAQSSYLQSIVTELKFLQDYAQVPLGDLLVRLVKERVIERHLWVAIEKFRGQGDYTFLLESDEGRIRVRQKGGPVLTNPRLTSAIAFLTDIFLLGEGGPTAAGLRLLEAS
jgi:hypothetical protein